MPRSGPTFDELRELWSAAQEGRPFSAITIGVSGSDAEEDDPDRNEPDTRMYRRAYRAFVELHQRDEAGQPVVVLSPAEPRHVSTAARQRGVACWQDLKGPVGYGLTKPLALELVAAHHHLQLETSARLPSPVLFARPNRHAGTLLAAVRRRRDRLRLVDPRTSVHEEVRACGEPTRPAWPPPTFVADVADEQLMEHTRTLPVWHQLDNWLDRASTYEERLKDYIRNIEQHAVDATRFKRSYGGYQPDEGGLILTDFVVQPFQWAIRLYDGTDAPPAIEMRRVPFSNNTPGVYKLLVGEVNRPVEAAIGSADALDRAEATFPEVFSTVVRSKDFQALLAAHARLDVEADQLRNRIDTLDETELLRGRCWGCDADGGDDLQSVANDEKRPGRRAHTVKPVGGR